MIQTRPYSLLRATARMLALTLWCIIAPLTFFIAKFLRFKRLEQIPMLFHRGCCRILSIRSKFQGKLCTHRPTLYISNHISYLDIFVLGGTVPGCFIAKSEVARWPVLGRLARIQNTLFFERKGTRAHSQIAVMHEQLSNEGNLILFPEGTSTEGAHVEPFKSSLFHAAEITENVLIQPITVAYSRYKDKPMPQSIREYYAWYATMPFLPHFLKMTGMHSVQAELIFHPPVKLQDFESRKSCAEFCQHQVASALQEVLAANTPKELPHETNTTPSHANSMD